MTVARVEKYRPLISDELSLTGETFAQAIGFKSLDDDGKTVITTDYVCIYVPAAIRKTDDTSVGETYETMVFWTANNAVLDTVLNDTITHALRFSADFYNCVLISLPSPGDRGKHVTSSEADFFVFSDEEIQLCFLAAGLKGKSGNIRLASHSRGHRGLTRTLMGNNSIGTKKFAESRPETAAIKTSFIDIRNIIKIAYFDNFFQSANRIVSDLVAKGLSDAVLTVYRVTDGLTKKDVEKSSAFKDIDRQFLDLTPITQPAMAAIGCTRFINEEILIVAALGENTFPLSNRIAKNANLAKLLESKKLPKRLTFSSATDAPDGKTSLMEFSKTINFTNDEEQILLRFFNAEQILRPSRRRPGEKVVFDTKLAAHHLFVCELIYEIFE